MVGSSSDNDSNDGTVVSVRDSSDTPETQDSQTARDARTGLVKKLLGVSKHGGFKWDAAAKESDRPDGRDGAIDGVNATAEETSEVVDSTASSDPSPSLASSLVSFDSSSDVHTDTYTDAHTPYSSHSVESTGKRPEVSTDSHEVDVSDVVADLWGEPIPDGRLKRMQSSIATDASNSETSSASRTGDESPSNDYALTKIEEAGHVDNDHNDHSGSGHRDGNSTGDNDDLHDNGHREGNNTGGNDELHDNGHREGNNTGGNDDLHDNGHNDGNNTGGNDDLHDFLSGVVRELIASTAISASHEYDNDTVHGTNGKNVVDSHDGNNVGSDGGNQNGNESGNESVVYAVAYDGKNVDTSDGNNHGNHEAGKSDSSGSDRTSTLIDSADKLDRMDVDEVDVGGSHIASTITSTTASTTSSTTLSTTSSTEKKNTGKPDEPRPMDVDVPMEIDDESVDFVVVGNADDHHDDHVDDTVDRRGGHSRENVDRLVNDKVLADTAITVAPAIIATRATDTVVTDATSVGKTDVSTTSGTTGNDQT
ncbi:hypothetical protein [Apis mellifera filamentous virus]|uniref:hypothetical protein n=1 Tax=Apis mellifera filamentous virus TaxID=1100043 RepID=UPI0006BDBBAD|nr:hypothetical protein APL35_gp116 [Apis mellifera filamentous virus]AKY03185.1 hypothetical protein [Apis mellifera filamentous virus]